MLRIDYNPCMTNDRPRYAPRLRETPPRDPENPRQTQLHRADRAVDKGDPGSVLGIFIFRIGEHTHQEILLRTCIQLYGSSFHWRGN